MWSEKSTGVSLQGGCGTERSAEGGQKPYKIQPDKPIDFTALTKSQARWLKTNVFGHSHYRKCTGDNAWNPYLAEFLGFARLGPSPLSMSCRAGQFDCNRNIMLLEGQNGFQFFAGTATIWSNFSPLDPSPRPTSFLRPSHVTTLPCFQRARWNVSVSRTPLRGTSSSWTK
jgi:hypothetical protein